MSQSVAGDAHAGAASSDPVHGSFPAERSWQDSQLYRVLREAPVLNVLPDDDKTSLAATCWGALEMVLRDSRAVLKVHPDDPVLAGLAARVTDGPCEGSATVSGVRVSATDAGLLLDATKHVRPMSAEDYQSSIWRKESGKEVTLAWVDLMRRCGEARVTGLRMPLLDTGHTLTEEARAVAEVLDTPAVKGSLRSLEMVQDNMFPLDERAGVIRGALRGLSALQHVKLSYIPISWAQCLIEQHSCLTQLELSYTSDDHKRRCAGDWESFFDALEQATNLRTLKLEGGYSTHPDFAGMRPRALPAGLEVLRMDVREPLRWWEATSLISLEIYALSGHLDLAVWGRITQLLAGCEKLRQLKFYNGQPVLDRETALAFFSALERSKVETLVLYCPPCPDAVLGRDLTAAAASAMSNAALRELEVWSLGFMDSFDRSAVIGALHNTTTLQKLALTFDLDEGCFEALGDLLSHNTSLVELHLGYLGEEDASCREALVESVGTNRTLQVLRLCSQVEKGPPDEFVVRLMDALYGGDRHEGRQLHTLEIDSDNLTDDSVKRIAAALEEQPVSKLRRLRILCGRAGDGGLAAIARALRRNCSLVSLVLLPEYFDVKEQSLESLAASLVGNTTLRHLEIRGWESGTVNSYPLPKQVLHTQQFAIAQRQARGQGH